MLEVQQQCVQVLKRGRVFRGGCWLVRGAGPSVDFSLVILGTAQQQT